MSEKFLGTLRAPGEQATFAGVLRDSHRRARARAASPYFPFYARGCTWAIAETKGFNAQNKASRKYGHYAVNHDHAFKFVPAELRQMMAGPGCWRLAALGA
jgi:hypothetical protein